MEKQLIDSKPFKVSWIIDLLETNSQPTLALSNPKASAAEKRTNSFGICAAPGKNLAKGRDGRTHKRDIAVDVKYFREVVGIDVIICLLNKYELRTIGVDLDKYQQACTENNVQLIVYPIVEMGIPAHSHQEFDATIVSLIIETINNKKKVICHCRGGIGRAGTVASCTLIKAKLCKGPKNAISTVRSLRDPKCVESRKQEDFITAYHKIVASLLEVPKASKVTPL